MAGQQDTVSGNDVKRRWIGRGGYNGGVESMILIMVRGISSIDT